MKSATKAFLKEAVHHNRITTRSGVLERLFTRWFRGFVYNQIWEDPRVDAEALRLGPGNRMLTISSAGCNVLNYLVHDLDQIFAIDLNTCHMSLTRLKLAALQYLPTYDDFYNFFGLGDHESNLWNYFTYISETLDEVTRRFWESSSWPGGRIGRKRIDYFTHGFYDMARLGQLLRMLHRIGRVMRRDPNRLLEARSREEQELFYQEVVMPVFENRFVKWVGRLPVSVFNLGIPPSQYRVMKEESNGQLVDLYRERLRRLTCQFPIEENYFAWQAFGRRYDHVQRKAVPDYLRRENYELLRERVNRVETHIASLMSFLDAQSDQSLDRFVLLDSQDWMPAEVIASLWEEIHRVGKPGSRIIFRTAGVKSPVEVALPRNLRKRFVYELDLSHRLYEQDRSAIYGMFHVYSKR